MLALVITVAILIVLFILSALSWRFVLAISALFEWLAIPFRFFAVQIVNARDACKKGVEQTLKWPPIRKDRKDGEEYWKGIDVIGRLILLIVSICIYGADLPFTQQRSAFLLGIVHLTHINLPLDILGGILWLAVPGLWGVVILELLGLTPSGIRLFPHIDNKAIRLCFTVIAFLFFVLALVDTAYFYYYGQFPIVISQSANSNLSLGSTTDIAQLGLFIVLAFGFVITGVAAIALWAFVLGFTGLISIILGMMYCVLSLCYLPFALLGSWITSFGEMIEKSQPVHIIRRTVTIDARSVPQLTKVVESQNDYVEAVQSEQEENHVDNKRNTVLVAFGHAGLELLAQTLERVIHIRAEDCILAYGGLDQYQSTKPNQVLPHIQGAENITPTDHQVGRHSSVSNTIEETFESLTISMVSSIKQAYAQAKCTTGTILIFADILMSSHMVTAIEKLKDSLPMSKILLITSFPHASQRNERVASAGDDFLELQQKGKIETILLSDPASVSAKQQGQAKIDAYLALCIASLIVAPYHYRHNPPLQHLADLLGMISPVIGFSFATAHVAAGKIPWWWYILKKIRPSLPTRGSGDVNDTIRQAKLMIDDLGKQTSRHFIIVLDIPIPLTDRRFKDCAQNVTAYLTTKFSNGGGIVVRENGIPDLKQGEGYFSTCTLLYPLTKAAFLPELEEEKLLEVPVEGVNGNKPHTGQMDYESNEDSEKKVGTNGNAQKESSDT